MREVRVSIGGAGNQLNESAAADQGRLPPCSTRCLPPPPSAFLSLHRRQEKEKALTLRISLEFPSLIPQRSLVKPDIVFFGESLPDRFFQCCQSDLRGADLLIVMGTSLQVQPFASLMSAQRQPLVCCTRSCSVVACFSPPECVFQITVPCKAFGFR